MASLKVGDQFQAEAGGANWTVRSCTPERLRLVSPCLRGSTSLRDNLLLVAADYLWICALRVNVQAGSLVIMRSSVDRAWSRMALRTLLNHASRHGAELSAPTQGLSRGPLLRLLMAAGLLAGQWLLVETLVWPLALLLLPGLLAPPLLEVLKDLGRPRLPVESMDLIWFGSLIARAEWDGLATELALQNGNELLRDSTQSGSYGEEMQEELNRRVTHTCFPLAGAAPGESRSIAELVAGDEIILKTADLVPLNGVLVRGRATVSKRRLNGECTPLAVQPFQRLPVGVELLEGEINFKVIESVSDQPLYAELFALGSIPTPPSGIARARELHRRSLPFLLGGGLLALIAGQPHRAASLMQFDPANDWQLSASISYRSARELCRGWGVILRQASVLDRLAKCRTLVIAEGAISFGVERKPLKVLSADPNFNASSILELVAGFRCYSPETDGQDLYPLKEVVQLNDLQPRLVEQITSIGGAGLQGLVDGQKFSLGGGSLLRQMGVKRPLDMPVSAGCHWVFVLRDRRVVGAVCFSDRLAKRVRRSLKRLRQAGWNLHLVSAFNSDMLDGIARTLEMPLENLHPAANLSERMELIRGMTRDGGPIAYLGSALLDSGAFAEADISLAVSDGGFSLPTQLADIILPAQRLDRLVDCLAIACDVGANNRLNLYMMLVPHSAALLLSLLIAIDPLIAVLLADVPLLLIELNNLRTYAHLRSEHTLGWRAKHTQRKRTSRSRPASLAPEAVRAAQ
jgi:Cu2+-exporting ATPase